MFYVPGHSQSQYMFCDHLQQMSILLLLSEVFLNVNQVILVDSVVDFFYIPVGCLSSSVHCQEGLLKCSTIITNLSIFPSSSISFSFIYFAVLLSSTYTFRIGMSSWQIDPFNHYVMSLSVSSNFLCSEIDFI